MRPVISVLLILLVAWGVHHLLGDSEYQPRTPAPLPEPDADAGTDPGRPIAKHALLVVQLLGPDQEPIEDGEVGTDIGGAVRWVPVGRAGKRTYPDMEPGIVRVLGRADGRVQVEQRRHLTEGVRTEVKLILRPKK